MIGIEIDKEAAAKAETWYDEVLVGDLNTPVALEEEFLESFDVVVFADVLEHLVEPGKALKHYARYAAPDAKILISIPNVANWLNRLELLLGRWEYRDVGILDKTHLRFFTYGTARRLIENAGLRIERTLCTSGSRSLDIRFGTRNPANLWRGLLAFQFIFQCGRRGAT